MLRFGSALAIASLLIGSLKEANLAQHTIIEIELDQKPSSLCASGR